MINILLTLILLLTSQPVMAGIIILNPSKDTKIDPNNVTTNYGTDTTCSSFGFDAACLIAFDLASTGITASEVVEAELKVYGESRGFQHSMSVSQLLRNWSSSQATWNVYSTGNSWGTAGAKNSSSDFSTTNQASGVVPDNDYMAVDVTELVKDQLNGTNNGFILRGVGGSFYQTWRMSEYAGTAYDPQLTIRTGTPGIPTHYYVRPNGGTCGLGTYECLGTTDADYPGTGTNQACACSHPKYIMGDESGIAALWQGEDYMHVKRGTYDITIQLLPVPAGGTAAAPTHILGEGWDTSCTASTAPVFRGKGIGVVLPHGDNMEVNCLKITDNSGCLLTRPTGATGRIDNAPAQDFITCADGSASDSAAVGLESDGASGVTLENMWIWGMSNEGIRGYRYGEWTQFNVWIEGSGYVGFSFDPPSGDENATGPMTLIGGGFRYSGCGWRAKATAGGDAADTPHNCYSQSQTGYGDAWGGNGSSGSMVIKDFVCDGNVSDCIDLLYGAGNTIRIDRLRGEGNAGAVVKSGNADLKITNSMLIGNCTNWLQSPAVYGSIYAPGRAGTNCNNDGLCQANENFTNCSDCQSFDYCRPAQHATLSLSCKNGVAPEVANSTVTGNSDVLIFMDAGVGCNSSVHTKVSNSIIAGATEYNGGELDTADYFYSEGSGTPPTLDQSNNLICATKTWSTDCTGDATSTCIASCDTVFSGTLNDFTPGYYSGVSYFNEHYLAVGSPARDAASESVSLWNESKDVNYFDRGASWDIGALEYGSVDVTASCDDSILNQNEEQVDCGGVCDACTGGEPPPGEPPTVTQKAGYLGAGGVVGAGGFR
jgi:hypothetical protein